MPTLAQCPPLLNSSPPLTAHPCLTPNSGGSMPTPARCLPPHNAHPTDSPPLLNIHPHSMPTTAQCPPQLNAHPHSICQPPLNMPTPAQCPHLLTAQCPTPVRCPPLLNVVPPKHASYSNIYFCICIAVQICILTCSLCCWYTVGSLPALHSKQTSTFVFLSSVK